MLNTSKSYYITHTLHLVGIDHDYDADTILVLGPNSVSIGCIANTIFVRENECNRVFVESVNLGSRRFNMSLDIRMAEILLVIDYVLLSLRIK